MATDAIYDYLKNQNRPYSAGDIVSNLHNAHSKSIVQKALDELVAKKEIFEKTYGKQKIYCVVQDPQRDIEELGRINRELQAHANEVEMKRNEVEKMIREFETKLASLRKEPSLGDARIECDELKIKIKELAEKLDNLMESNGTEDLGIEKRKAEKLLNGYSREYAKRKRLCTEIIDCIMEGYPNSKKDLQNEIGIEVMIV